MAVVSEQFEGKRLLDRHRMVCIPLGLALISCMSLTSQACAVDTPVQQLGLKASESVQINKALEEEMKSIHALSIRQCWTPEQQKAKQST